MKQNRPLSPHLSVYKPQITAMLSIYHRITGAVLSLAIILLLFFNKVISFQLENYFLYEIGYLINSSGHWIVLSSFFAILFSLYYHFFNGIRHLIWDRAQLLEIQKVYQTGYFVIFLTILSTIITWYILFF